MEPWTLEPDITMRPLRAADSEPVHALISASRGHLDRWLRWSGAVRSLEDVRRLIARFEEQEARGSGFHLGIWTGATLAGGLVCWYIERENRNAEIGYWLGQDFTRRGLATRASARAVEHLFRTEGLHRIEMQCAVENVRSRAVPERLGFQVEGIRRQSHWITDRFVDHVIYGLLDSEWKGEF
jgi:ribosomal-protein-serine acetyltransferase